MDIDKDIIKRWLQQRANYPTENTCPFTHLFGDKGRRGSNDYCLDRFCGPIFPEWCKIEEDRRCIDGFIADCPCKSLSNKYVKKKFRKWLKE